MNYHVSKLSVDTQIKYPCVQISQGQLQSDFSQVLVTLQYMYAKCTYIQKTFSNTFPLRINYCIFRKYCTAYHVSIRVVFNLHTALFHDTCTPKLWFIPKIRNEN